jgi:hypothetical protein
MILPVDIKMIVHQMLPYNGADARYTQLKSSKFPSLLLVTNNKQVIKNINERELQFYLQLGRLGHANSNPIVWSFPNLNGDIAAIVYTWDVNPPIPVRYSLDTVHFDAAKAITTTIGVKDSDFQISESVNGDKVTFKLAKLGAAKFEQEYALDILNNTLNVYGFSGVSFDGGHWLATAYNDMNGSADPADAFFLSCKTVTLRRNNVTALAPDYTDLSKANQFYRYTSGIGGNVDANPDSSVPSFWALARWKAAHAPSFVINMTIVRTAGKHFVDEYTYNSNIAGGIVVTEGATDYTLAITLTGAIPLDGSGFVNINDVATPPPPAIDATLTVDMILAPGFNQFRMRLDNAVDGNITLNRVFADGFFPSGCFGSAIASAQETANQILAAGQTLLTFSTGIETGNWNLVGTPDSYNIFNCNLNGNPHLTDDIIVVGTKRVKIVLHVCS